MTTILRSLIILYRSLGQAWHTLVPLAPGCRFYPSCSDYALTALEKYGPWRGSLKTAGRLVRCHPLAQGGIDLL